MNLTGVILQACYQLLLQMVREYTNMLRRPRLQVPSVVQQRSTCLFMTLGTQEPQPLVAFNTGFRFESS